MLLLYKSTVVCCSVQSREWKLVSDALQVTLGYCQRSECSPQEILLLHELHHLHCSGSINTFNRNAMSSNKSNPQCHSMTWSSNTFHTTDNFEILDSNVIWSAVPTPLYFLFTVILFLIPSQPNLNRIAPDFLSLKFQNRRTCTAKKHQHLPTAWCIFKLKFLYFLTSCEFKTTYPPDLKCHPVL